MEVPGNVGTDQQAQVFRSHLIFLAELADIFQVREQEEKGLPGKIFNKEDSLPSLTFISKAQTCLVRQLWIKSVLSSLLQFSRPFLSAKK